MQKPIEHPYPLSIQYYVEEDSNITDRENVTVIISEDIPKNEQDEDFDIQEYKDNNFFVFSFVRIFLKEETKNNIINTLETHSTELLEAVLPILSIQNKEFMSHALKIDNMPDITNILYLKNATIKGQFSKESIVAATSKAFNVLSKGTPEDKWIGVLYQDMTFFKNNIAFDKTESKSILKEINIFPLPEGASKVGKINNVLAVVSGKTLNSNLKFQQQPSIKHIYS